MSTVLITKTHIGSDHCSVIFCHPHKTVIDTSFSKLFIDPKERFVFGAVGAFRPEKIKNSKVYLFLEMLIEKAISFFDADRADIMRIGNDIVIKAHNNVFDPEGRIIISTRKYNFVVYVSKSDRCICVKLTGDYAGIGVGGSVGVGMLEGGVPIEDVWEKINHLDPLSSAENTIIPLSILKDWNSV